MGTRLGTGIFASSIGGAPGGARRFRPQNHAAAVRMVELAGAFLRMSASIP
jgi:hypothetical protein